MSNSAKCLYLIGGIQYDKLRPCKLMNAILEKSNGLKNAVHCPGPEIFAVTLGILQAGYCKVCKHNDWSKTSKPYNPNITLPHACGVQTSCPIKAQNSKVMGLHLLQRQSVLMLSLINLKHVISKNSDRLHLHRVAHPPMQLTHNIYFHIHTLFLPRLIKWQANGAHSEQGILPACSATHSKV